MLMKKSALWGLVCAIILSTCSMPVAATTDTVDIPARTYSGASVGWQKLVFDSGDYIVWNWTSTGSLDFQLFDPNGNELMNQEQSVGTNGVLPVSTTGTYSWRYSNWNTATVTVMFFWGRIDKANVIEERLMNLEADFQRLNQSVSLMQEYLDDVESGSEKYPWLEENLTRIQSETQQILLRMDGMPVNADIDDLDSDISELNAQVIQLQENLTKVQDENTKYRNDVSMLLGVFIVIVAIALVVLMMRGRGRKR